MALYKRSDIMVYDLINKDNPDMPFKASEDTIRFLGAPTVIVPGETNGWKNTKQKVLCLPASGVEGHIDIFYNRLSPRTVLLKNSMFASSSSSVPEKAIPNVINIPKNILRLDTNENISAVVSIINKKYGWNFFNIGFRNKSNDIEPADISLSNTIMVLTGVSRFSMHIVATNRSWVPEIIDLWYQMTNLTLENMIQVNDLGELSLPYQEDILGKKKTVLSNIFPRPSKGKKSIFHSLWEHDFTNSPLVYLATNTGQMTKATGTAPILLNENILVSINNYLSANNLPLLNRAIAYSKLGTANDCPLPIYNIGSPVFQTTAYKHIVNKNFTHVLIINADNDFLSNASYMCQGTNAHKNPQSSNTIYQAYNYYPIHSLTNVGFIENEEWEGKLAFIHFNLNA